MKSDVNIFHHVGLATADLEATVARYELLGFTFTPISHVKIALKPGAEPEPLGAGNRCGIFQNNYLEIVGILDKKRWDTITRAQRGPFDIDGPISRYEGLHIMHFGTDDIEAVRERLMQQGTVCSEIARLQRNVDTPDGERTMYAKSIHFPPGSNPEGLIQIAQHVTPELVLQPRYMDQPNGAKNVTEVIVCTTDPARYSAKYERYTGHRGERSGNRWVVNPGYSRVVVVAPEQLAEVIPGCEPPAIPFLAGFTVATASLDRTRELLNKNCIPFHENGERLIVRPEDARGCAVLFEKEGASRF